jgi:dUTP pyrophosphatase
MKIYVKKVDGVALPQQGSEAAAGYDIVATSDPKTVGDTEGPRYQCVDYIEYETNLFIAPANLTSHVLIHPRSSISKYNLVLANSVGLVDNDYRGMILCRFKYIWQPGNFSIHTEGETIAGLIGKVDIDKIYKKGDKIAQLVVEPTVKVEWAFVDDLTQTQRGEGGFGSTDGKTMIANPIKFEEGPSNMAERYRKLNYIEKPQKTYEQLVKESQQT